MPLLPEYSQIQFESGDNRDIKIDWLVESGQKLIVKHLDELTITAMIMLVKL